MEKQPPMPRPEDAAPPTPPPGDESCLRKAITFVRERPRLRLVVELGIEHGPAYASRPEPLA